MEAVIDSNYAYIIERIDPDILVPKLKSHLTVGGSDYYYQVVSQCEGKTVLQDRNEKLLSIIRDREEMWKPFISACRECDYQTIADLLEAGLNGEAPPPTNPSYNGRNKKRKQKINMSHLSRAQKIFGKAIDEIYAEFLEIDADHLVRMLKAQLTVGGSDRYFKKLTKTGRTRQKRNADLLDIIRNRDEMWKPFTDALRECGYEIIAQHFEDALANCNGQRRQRTRSGQQSVNLQSAKELFHSSGTKSVPLDTANLTNIPFNNRLSSLPSDIISSRDSLTDTDQSPACPDEDADHQVKEGMGTADTKWAGTESGQEDSNENGGKLLGPENLREPDNEADVKINLTGFGKPLLLPKHIPGVREDTPTSSRPAVGNIPNIVLEFTSSSSTEDEDSDVESSQLYGPGDIQQHQDDLYVDPITGSIHCPTFKLSESEDVKVPKKNHQVPDEKQFDVEKYSSKCCLSERSENPSVHDRLAEEALNAQSINQSQYERDAARGTPGVVEVQPPVFEGLQIGGTYVGNMSMSWKSIMEYSFMVFADSILPG